MTQQGALLLMIGLALVLIGLMAWGWWRRTRRDSGIAVPLADPAAEIDERARFDVFYVATTVHERPLERLAARGLAYRAPATLVVTDRALLLAIAGEPTVELTASRVVDVAQATVAIDRVVERAGLARITWTIDDGTPVDTYLRARDASAKVLADAVRPLLTSSPSTPAGSDA